MKRFWGKCPVWNIKPKLGEGMKHNWKNEHSTKHFSSADNMRGTKQNWVFLVRVRNFFLISERGYETFCIRKKWIIQLGMKGKKWTPPKLNSPGNFEAKFIEIILPDRKNVIIGCIYRHGSGIPLRDFTNNLLEPLTMRIKSACLWVFSRWFTEMQWQPFCRRFFNMFTSYFSPFVLPPKRFRSKTHYNTVSLVETCCMNYLTILHSSCFLKDLLKSVVCQKLIWLKETINLRTRL